MGEDEACAVVVRRSVCWQTVVDEGTKRPAGLIKHSPAWHIAGVQRVVAVVAHG